MTNRVTGDQTFFFDPDTGEDKILVDEFNEIHDLQSERKSKKKGQVNPAEDDD